MAAIFKREFKTFFTSPIGYCVLAVIFAFSGFMFYTSNLISGSPDLRGVYDGLFSIILLLVLPILTMRLMSEDKRQKTDQALLTAPVGLTGIVVGKFLAALAVFALGMSITLVYALVIALRVTPDWMVILGNYIGILLLGGMVIAIGLLISSLTESQLISAIGTFAVSLMLIMIDSLAYVLSNTAWLVSVINFLSVASRYSDFTTGIVSYDNVIFFLSMQALFLFLTVRILDRKRWS